MKFGYVCNPARFAFTGNYQDIIRPIREIAQYCDEAGLDSIWLGEHHFGLYGRANLPNPVAMAIDIAARTRRLHVGLASVTVGLWHPLRLAEDIALADQLSEGRLIVGVGRGNHSIEFENLNPVADPRNTDQNMAVFRETVEVLKRALSQPHFSFKGDFYTFPRPGFTGDARKLSNTEYLDKETGEVISLPLVPPSFQKPHPPMWQMVDSARSIEFAGANGLGAIMWRPPVKKLKEHFAKHRAKALEAGLDRPFGSGTGIMRDMFVADTMEQAREIAGEAIVKHLNWSNWRGPDIFLNPGETLPEEEDKALRASLNYDFVHPRSLLFGSPEYVVERLQEMKEELNIEQVLVNSSWDGVPEEASMRSLRLFAEKVIPRLR